MIIAILKTIEMDEKDGFPKLWVRTFKDEKNYKKNIPNPDKHHAWYVWKLFKGDKLSTR